MPNLKGHRLKEWKQKMAMIKKEFDTLFDPQKQKKKIIETLAKKFDLAYQTTSRICQPIKWGKRDGKAKNANDHKTIMKKLNKERPIKELKEQITKLHKKNRKALEEIRLLINTPFNDN